MFKKKSFWIIFLLGIVLFFNLTNINRVSFYVKSDNINPVLVKSQNNMFFKDIKPNQENYQKTAVVVNEDIRNFTIQLQNTPATIKLKNIIIVSTLFPFNISDKNLDNYFEFQNVEVQHEKGFNKLTFNDNSSCLKSKSLLLNMIFALRIVIVLALAFLLACILIPLSLLGRFASIISITLVILTVTLPILLSPINMFKLSGVQENQEFPAFSINAFKTKSFQSEFEKYLNQKLTFNNFHIKVLNTVLYYTFKHNQSNIVGKNDTLYQPAFIDLVISNKPLDTNFTENSIKEIKKLQDFYEKQGKTFVVVITPNKANAIQDKIPRRFNLSPQYIEKNYKLALELFDKYDIKYIDTKKYTVENTKEHIFFPQGGVHWGDYPKYLATKLFLEKLNTYGDFNFEPLTINHIYKNNLPFGDSEDVDLAQSLNLLVPPTNYPSEHVYVKPFSKTSNKTVKVISGSFWWGMTHMLNQAKAFNSIDVYFYLIRYQTPIRFFIGQPNIDITDRNKLRNDINSGDLIVLEINESCLDFKTQKYIKEFTKLILNEN